MRHHFLMFIVISYGHLVVHNRRYGILFAYWGNVLDLLTQFSGLPTSFSEVTVPYQIFCHWLWSLSLLTKGCYCIFFGHNDIVLVRYINYAHFVIS